MTPSLFVPLARSPITHALPRLPLQHRASALVHVQLLRLDTLGYHIASCRTELSKRQLIRNLMSGLEHLPYHNHA